MKAHGGVATSKLAALKTIEEIGISMKGPSFDEETYRQAVLPGSTAAFKGAGKSLKGFVEFIINNYSEKIVPLSLVEGYG